MVINETAIRLGIPEITRIALQNLYISPEQEDDQKQLFLQDTEAFVNNTDPLETLWLYLSLAKDAKAAFERRGIPESVFWDSMTDIGIWSRNYFQKTGLPGIGEPQWVAKSLKLEVIRLGRLQFEPAYLKQSLQNRQNTYPVGTPILHVHIPAEEKLHYDAVLDSVNQAKDFFRNYFDFEPVLMQCHSWLLSPELQKLLQEASNIIKFQSLFHIYQTDDGRQAEERVFGEIRQNPATYPEHTILQKRMKAHLLAGHTIGMGSGVRILGL